MTDTAYPILVAVTDPEKADRLRGELRLQGCQLTDLVWANTYGTFAVALERPVWPELKAVLDETSWFQVNVVKMKKQLQGNRG